MVHQDTIELLRECDAGIQMGVSPIADVLPHVQSDTFLALLETCQTEHEKLAREIAKALDRQSPVDDGPRHVRDENRS